MISTKKNWWFVFIAAGMILPSAFLFCVVASLPHVFIIICFGFLASFLFRTPIKYSDRSVIYSAVGSFILVVLLNMVFPIKGDRFFHIGQLLIAHITVPLLLYLAVFSTFYEPSAYTLGFSSTFSLVALMFGGDYRLGAYSSKDPQMFFQSLLEVGTFKIFFLIAAMIVLVMMLIAFNLARKSLYHKSTRKIDWLKGSFYGVAVVVAVLLTFGVLFTVNAYKQELRELENFLVKARYPNIGNPSGIMFSNDIDLNTTIKANRKTNSRMIMLRVVSPDYPPGYLRGKSYLNYSKGRWKVGKYEIKKQCRFKININKLALSAFFIGTDPGGEGDAITIYPSNTCYADFLFLPGNSKRIEMVSDRLFYTPSGTFYPHTWESDAGYTARVSKVDQYASFDLPATFSKQEYLEFPPELDGTLSSISNKIFLQNSAGFKKLSDRQITEKIKDFFSSNFTYTLEPEAPENNEDLLDFFMTKTRRGHCELFASSAAMLLRKQGIPSRYVTGMMCIAEHPSGNYYVSRLGDAHAWVEAYLRDEQRWIIVETTPASGDDSPAEWGFFESWFDRVKYSLSKILADARRGYIARAIFTTFTELFSFFWSVISHPIGGIIFTISLLFLVWRYRFRKKRKKHLQLKLDEEILLLQKLILKLEKKITKETAVLRTSQMSFEEWLTKLRTSQKVKNEELAKLADLLNDYNKLRFSTNKISTQALDSWKRVSDEVLDKK